MVRTRFAPSPTGRLHPGNLRTALFNALYAAHTGGAFVLRIEDTDAARSREEHDEALLGDLRWLGLHWDEGPDVSGPLGPYRQSERAGIHAEHLERLHRERAAYPCFCSRGKLAADRARARAEGRPPRYPGTCAKIPPNEAQRRLEAGEAATLRFRVPPDRDIVFDDIVHGEQRTHSSDIGDFVIRRADGTPAFFFANALDDALMEITHVLRGEDHLANTPRQLLLLEALGLPAPRYGHLPLVLDAAGGPLSKRGGSASLADLRAAGILPEALSNYLLRLGHGMTNTALLDAAGRASTFDPAHLGRAPAHYDPSQLEHWQRLAVHALDAEHARRWADETSLSEARWPAFWSLVQDNVTSRAEVAEWIECLGKLPSGEALADASPDLLEAALALSAEPDYATVVKSLRERTGLGGRKLFMPLRLALTGRHNGPELARLWVWFTPAERRERFQHALKVVHDSAP
jgi:glutamyl-tRNA synthetase